MLHARAILFDIDGTLVDSAPVVERAWRTWALEYSVDADEVIRVCHGRRTEDTVAEFVTQQQLAVAVARLQALELADFDGVTALPGAQQLLAALPSRLWAAVTSGERDLMTGRLSAARLPIPETMVCAEDVDVGKPSPEGYVKAAAALGVDPKDCVVIEDAPAGIAAGSAAGAQVVAVTTTHTASQMAGADVTVADLSCLSVGLTGDGVVLTDREFS